MSKLYVSYQSFPNCYEATQYSKGRAGMSAALRLLGVILTICYCVEFVEAVNICVEKNKTGSLIATIAIFLGVLAFDFYAFVWRVHQTNYGLNLIFIDEAYRRAAVYGEEKRSQEFINKCEEKRANEKYRAKNEYWKTVKKSAIIYSMCTLVVALVITLFTIF